MFKHSVEVVKRAAIKGDDIAHTVIVDTWSFLGLTLRRAERVLNLL